MLVSAPEARSAEGDEGGAAALVSSAADLYQDKHTPCAHVPDVTSSKSYDHSSKKFFNHDNICHVLYVIIFLHKEKIREN